MATTLAGSRQDMEEAINLLDAGNIPDLCQIVHESLTGAAERINDGHLSIILSVLCDRNRLWHTSPSETAEYDQCVRLLMQATINDIKAEVLNRKP